MQDDHVSTDLTSNVIWIDEEAAAQSSVRYPAPAIDQAEFTIGELSREFGMTLRALRFYENKGLVAPRREGGTRIYSRTDRSRLALIRNGKRSLASRWPRSARCCPAATGGRTPRRFG